MKGDKTPRSTAIPPDRALSVQVVRRGEDRERAERLLAELNHLARSAGLLVLENHLPGLAKILPATYLGKGALERLTEIVSDREIDVVVFNNALTPVQQRNLERTLKAKVVDRTGLILEIFAARARTREGTLQVALASLLYQQSRLVRSWTHLERQRGGVGLRGGPGEAQIEVDRRLIRDRIQSLKKSLNQVQRTRSLHRRARRDVPFYSVALVGYTNAGKSTLFNRLTTAEVEAADRLFATLDPTLRLVDLPGGERIILGDTVGFIRDLPHQLVAAFRATLEEVLAADLLLHVVDLSDPEWADQERAVHEVLTELGADQKPLLTLFNKVDRLPADSGIIARLDDRPDTLVISAKSGAALDRLLATLETHATRDNRSLHLKLPVSEGRLLARLCQEGRVLNRREHGAHIHLTVSLSKIAAGRLRHEIDPFVEPDPTESRNG